MNLFKKKQVKEVGKATSEPEKKVNIFLFIDPHNGQIMNIRIDTAEGLTNFCKAVMELPAGRSRFSIWYSGCILEGYTLLQLVSNISGPITLSEAQHYANQFKKRMSISTELSTKCSYMTAFNDFKEKLNHDENSKAD